MLTDPTSSAFLLARFAGPEAEILTLCSDPDARRSGLARGLLGDLENLAREQRTEEIFLEVSETNQPARALYASAGYVAAGYRKNYYEIAQSQAVSALVLHKPLT